MLKSVAAAVATMLLGSAGGGCQDVGAAEGLDPSFSGDGLLTRNLLGEVEEARDVTILSDGGILVDAVAPDARVVLGYRGDGSPDASFGRDGVLRTPAAGQVVEQPDGKLLLLSSSRTGIAVRRIARDGSPDRSFGARGVSVIGKGALGDEDCIAGPSGAALTRGGRIVLTGDLGCGGEDGGDLGIYVARLHADGRLDRSFGRAGAVISYRACDAVGVTIQRSGKIVVAGTTGNSSYCTFGSMLLTRLRADGSVDRTFGRRGRKVIRFPGGGDSVVKAFATDRRGRLYLAGSAKDRLAVVRVLPTGKLDRTFGGDGRVTRRTETPADEDGPQGATGIAVGHDGRVTVSGKLKTGTRSQFALVRFLRDGRADASLAPRGTLGISFGSETANALDVALDADGRSIAVGWTGLSEESSDIAIARVR